MQTNTKKLMNFRINGFDAYKFGQNWICLCDNKIHSFESLARFTCFAADETHKRNVRELENGKVTRTFDPLAPCIN